MDSPTLEHVLELPRLPARPADAHKGDFGRVLVIAGSRGLAGAAILCGSGALRGGAGLVTVACPADVQDVVAGGSPCYMTAALPPEASGLPPADVVAIGSGTSHAENIGKIAVDLITRFPGPMVVDADALAAVGRGQFARPNSPPAVLTPHPGEFAKLLGTSIAAVQADREAHAAAFALAEGVVLLLKGSRTVVTDGRRVYTNPTGNPGMATGGCGDLLTGLIAALLGQGLAPFDAACLGAWAQARAGDLAARHYGEVSMTAADVLTYLPAAMKECSDRADR